MGEAGVCPARMRRRRDNVNQCGYIYVSRQFNFQNHMREVENNKKLQNNKKAHQRGVCTVHSTTARA